jgi:AraC-like DNA-binding protein
MKGGVFLHAEFSAPWCVSSQIAPEDCVALMRGAGHLALYHYVVEGTLRARVGNGAAVELGPGNVLLMPHNHQHWLGGDLNITPVATKQLITAPPEGGLWEINHGGGGEKTRLICGFLGCDRLQGNPLIDALPSFIVFDTGGHLAPSWIRGTLEFAAAQISARQPGAETVLAKLSELLFVEALRTYVDGLPPEQTGWLAGLKDPFVSRALAYMHEDVARAWTVDDLGRAVGLSRSALAQRFADVIGETPIKYLARWRLQVAAHTLRTSEAPIARVAEQVGYTEFAFNRAFKREFGQAPAAWRKAAA